MPPKDLKGQTKKYGGKAFLPRRSAKLLRDSLFITKPLIAYHKMTSGGIDLLKNTGGKNISDSISKRK